MEFGISSACFYPLDTLESFDVLGSLEVKTAEIFVNAPSEYSPEGLKEIIAKKDYYGISIYSYHPYTSFSEPFMLFSGYERRKKDGIDDYKYQFEAARKLGARVFNFHGDFKGGYPTTPAQYAELYHTLFVAAKEEGLFFSQENVSRCKCGYPDFLRELKRELGNEIYFTLDVKQAIRAGVSLFELIDIMEGNIANFHLSDSDETHDCLLPFYGTSPLNDIIKCINLQYKGPAIIEVYSQNYRTVADFHESLSKLANFDKFNQSFV